MAVMPSDVQGIEVSDVWGGALRDGASAVQDVLLLRPGDHLCLVYDGDPSDQFPALVPFLRQGLENGERAVYVSDDGTIEELGRALTEYGVDVKGRLDDGSLVLWTRSEWRQPGELDSARKADQVRRIIDDALRQGYSGVRFGIEMTWTLGPDIAADRLCHWEATINSILSPDLPVRMICQYSRRRLPPDVLQAALLTHPVAILGKDAFANPYHDGSLGVGSQVEAGAEGVDRERIDLMLSRLRWQRAFESERLQRLEAEQALQASRAAVSDLRDANAAKDDVLVLLSHELRTPLTVVSGLAAFLSRTVADSSEECAEAISEITRSTQRLTRIVTNLLLLARADGAPEPELEPILLGPILSGVVNDHHKRHPGRNIVVHDDAPHVPARGNAVYAEQVIANLLTNAEKYSAAATTIEVHLSVENAYRVLRVLDRGIGMPEGEAQKLFAPFYRSENAVKMGPGLGVGLAVCKRAIEAQGGTISCSNRDGGGSEFRFALPLSDEFD